MVDGERTELAAEELLRAVCEAVHLAERSARAEARRELFGDDLPFEILVGELDNIKIVIRKEDGRHKAPHMHVTHSDKIDASIDLRDFTVLTGEINKRTHKYLQRTLAPHRAGLNQIWSALKEGDTVKAEAVIDSLGLRR